MVESAFAVLMIVTASAMAFAHGSNDVANAIDPCLQLQAWHLKVPLVLNLLLVLGY